MCSQKNVKRIIFSEECQKKFRTQKRIHKLKDPKLRKIRFELRTLLNLEHKKRRAEFDEKLSDLNLEYSRGIITYNEMKDKKRDLFQKREKFNLLLVRSPIHCGWCGNRMEDLVFDPRRQCWFCTVCYEDAHQQYPEEYP